MMTLRTTLATGVALAALMGAANAADFGLRGAVPVAPVSEPIADTGGWYLRGDVGVGVAGSTRYDLSPAPAGVLPANGGNLAWVNQDRGASYFAGFGVGYRAFGWLRTDVTFELRGGNSIHAVDTYSCAALQCPPTGVTGRNAYAGSITSMVGMWNLYADLGTWHGITPYLGAGIGYAYHRTSAITDTGFATVGGVTTTTFGTFNGGNRGSFAWALMAGLGYQVTNNLTLELGYRYINMGSAASGLLAACSGGCPAPAPALAIRRMDNHDIRLGMRWMLGPKEVAVAPQPIVVRN